MDSRTPKPVILAGHERESPASRLRSIVRKSALLNVVIVLTSSPVLIYAGGPKAVVPTLKIMLGISILIWTSTFAVLSLVILPRIFRTPESSLTHRDTLHAADETKPPSAGWTDMPDELE